MPFRREENAPDGAPSSPLQPPAPGSADACCAPEQTPAPVRIVRRARLSDLDAHVHCSIIGTCLRTDELRKLVPRYDLAIDRKTSSDLDIHHAAVNLSTKSEVVAKQLTKILNFRHERAIRRFKSAGSAPALAALWCEAMANGDVPGAYWALMTHPSSTFELRSQAFGDVHMLSHLVGASNRADIRRLAALEQECVQLREQHAAHQVRLHELATQQQRATALADQESAHSHRLQQSLAALRAEDTVQALEQARATLASRQEQLALMTGRCTAYEDRLLASEDALTALRDQYAGQAAELASAQSEIQLLEDTLAQALTPDAASALPPLHGQAIAYVGGRQQSTHVLARLVAGAGGELLVHDGGVEDRKGLLAAMLSRATMVVFPVDCISHNAMQISKQLAARIGIPCHPMRKASIAGFVELMRRVGRVETAWS